jgi:chromate reductase
MPQPEAYIGGAAKLFDAKGDLVNESNREFFQKFMIAFAEWVGKNNVS